MPYSNSQDKVVRQHNKWSGNSANDITAAAIARRRLTGAPSPVQEEANALHKDDGHFIEHSVWGK